MKRVLVTGATGFIGSQILEPLTKLGYEVHATYQTKRPDSNKLATWHKANLLEHESIEALLREVAPTHLVHFAWYVNATDYKTSPENDKWTESSVLLLRTFADLGGQKAVFAGTCMEYDWNTSRKALAETSRIAPATPYGAAKARTRALCEQYAQTHGISFAWGRIFNVYGPGEADRRLVPRIIRAFLTGTSAEISAGVTLDYSYVEDVARAFAEILDSAVQGDINIASGIPITPAEIVEVIAEITGSSTTVQMLYTSPSPEYVVADVQKLHQELRWVPRYPLRQGLDATIKWWKATH